MEYGFFNFLGGTDRQLIVSTYSGGAHCCDDYFIYELGAKFRVLYDSSKYDSGSEIGNELVPVDIDGDGVFEFHRDVMAFDYFHASHAGSVFPPVIFAFDKDKRKYDFANRRFADFVMKLLRENQEWLLKQSRQDREEFYLRSTFLHLIYAGKQKEAWQYYDQNRTNDDADYQADVKRALRNDVVYQSIYKTQ